MLLFCHDNVMSFLLRSRRAPLVTFLLNRLLTLFIIATHNHYTNTAFIMKGRSNKRLSSSLAFSEDKEEKITKIMKLKREILSIETLFSTQKLLLDVGDLVPMVVVQRPSKSIKTPYIADLIFKPKDYSISNFQFEVPNDESTSNSSSSSTVSSTASTKESSKKSTAAPKKPSKKSIEVKQKAATVALSNALRATVPEEGITFSF
jgi:hypothetical protein